MPLKASEPFAKADSPHGYLRVRGARTHNLKNIDLDIPRGKFVVITGPSGSGKSSLAFDTLFAEGQRQYIESLSVFARQFFSQLQRPDVDEIEGLPPVICIDQRPGRPNPRSTVATTTEIYDFLRLLFARVGHVSCPRCGRPIQQQSLEQIQDALMAWPEGTKVMLLAPLVRGRKGQHAEVFEAVRKAGQVRVRVDGEIYDIDAVPPLDGRAVHTIEAVVDRIVIRPGSRSRLAESLQLAIKQGEGVVIAAFQIPRNRGEKTEDSGNSGFRIQKPEFKPGISRQRASGQEPTSRWTDRLFSTLYACPICQLSLEEIEPRTFSFNSPYGACPACQGLGYREEFDPELFVPDMSKSIKSGAVAVWRRAKRSGGAQGPGVRGHKAAVEAFLATHNTPLDTPLSEMLPSVREKLFRGDGTAFPGLMTLLEQEYVTATDPQRRGELEAFRGQVTCTACGGTRLRPEALAVRIAGKNIADVCRMSVDQARQFFQNLNRAATQPLKRPTDGETEVSRLGASRPSVPSLHPSAAPSVPAAELSASAALIARPILAEITARLGFLQKVGLDYLTLDRASDSLSGGELQRVRLATGIGSGLAGICYILDEPSIGLHPRDNQRLIDALRQLLKHDGTVLVVEHDESMMRQADWLIDMGPGAGSRGGRIVANGTPSAVMANPASMTGRYLSGTEAIDVPARRRKGTRSRSIVIEGVTTNNLQNVTAVFPLGLLIGVTGVSGSGKSSLVNKTLAPALIRRLGGVAAKPGPYASLTGVSQIDKVVPIDQSPLGRSPRSNPATYSGAFDEIRKVFASTKEARQMGFKAHRFSFNVPGGRCEECQGQGTKRLEMHFLPDLHVPCPACEGKRFNRQTLSVKYKGLTIADVLDLPIEKAVGLFENFPPIHRVLSSMAEIGLGYLPLGQSSTTLSGGESQRVKLATELARADTGKTLYLLDEPTTGLHFDDIRLLLGVLQKLVDRGNTVIVIEHHLDVLKCCDHLIDLGPSGGASGGRIIATGTPESLAAIDGNETGKHLARVLDQSRREAGTSR